MARSANLTLDLLGFLVDGLIQEKAFERASGFLELLAERRPFAVNPYALQHRLNVARVVQRDEFSGLLVECDDHR